MWLRGVIIALDVLVRCSKALDMHIAVAIVRLDEEQLEDDSGQLGLGDGSEARGGEPKSSVVSIIRGNQSFSQLSQGIDYFAWFAKRTNLRRLHIFSFGCSEQYFGRVNAGDTGTGRTFASYDQRISGCHRFAGGPS